MTIEVFDCEQNSEAWHRARMGIPTSSKFATVMAKGRDGGASLTRKTYLYELAGEILTDTPMEGYSNAFMERGKAMEDEARSFYAFLNDAEIQRVGFIRNGKKGCSPDGLIGTNGMHEIKTALPHIMIPNMLRSDFPPEHKAQCQGGLWVAEREWIDLQIYWPKMPPCVHRAYRDEAYIKNLALEVDRFNFELSEIVAQLSARYSVDKVAA